MEPNWTKRKLSHLRRGEAETVRQWQALLGRYLYTWFYYRLNKDSAQAATLTAQTLAEALGRLSAFDPEQSTMYLWLKDIAADQLQSAAAQQGITPQRPWAWSQMPPEVLESLKRFRSEPLAAAVPGCEAVGELVQATLADLSEQDRDLLVRRYNRLDATEHIASELNLPVDKANQRLYLARHAFQRGLFFLLRTSNASFNEPPPSGSMEVYEGNLEMLLRAVNPAATIGADHAEQIKQAVLMAAKDAGHHQPAANGGPARSGRSKAVLAVAAVAAVAVMAVVIFVGRHSRSPLPQETDSPPPQAETTPPEPIPVEPREADIDAERLHQVLEMGIAGDIDGLLAVLQNGGYIEQMAAAHYLGQHGGESEIAPLLQAQARWFPDGPQDNPFFRAVMEIEDRLYDDLPPEEGLADDAVEPQGDPEEMPQDTEQPEPQLLGQVVGFDGELLEGVRVSIAPDTLNTADSAGQRDMSAVTDEQGIYVFESLPDDVCVVAVHDPQGRIAETRRLIRPVTDRPLELDFGLGASVAGAAFIDDNPLAEQILLLSDNVGDPPQGVFTAEVQTDADGGFFFTGVPAGQYGVFSRFAANRWTLLEQVQVDADDVTLLVDQPTVDLVVQVADMPESGQVVAVSLRYGPDSADALAAWTAVRTEDERVFRINRVIAAKYTLCVDFDNGTRLLRPLVVDQPPEQVVRVDEIPYGTAAMAGRFLSIWPQGLTLAAVEPPIRVAVLADEDGNYQIGSLPQGMYSLGEVVNRQFVPYLEVGLFEDQPADVDPDPVRLSQSRSPLYVYVTDAQGLGLAGGQVWLDGRAGLYVAEPLGRGFFVAAPAGQYTLYADFDGYQTADKSVELIASDVHSPRSQANTGVIRLD